MKTPDKQIRKLLKKQIKILMESIPCDEGHALVILSSYVKGFEDGYWMGIDE